VSINAPLFRGGLSASVVLLCACAAEAPAVVKTASSPKPPGWLVKVPQDGDTLYFSGAREGAASLEEGTDAAMQVARAHAAEYIGVDVTSEHHDVMSTDLGADRVQDTVKGRASALVRGARIADVYYEKFSRKAGATTIDRFDVWVLVKISRAELEAERARQEEETRQIALAALARLREGEAQERAGNVLAALIRYRDAVAQSRALPNQIALADPQLRTSGQLRQAAQEAAAKAQAKARRAILVAPDWAAGPIVQALSSKGFSAVAQPEGSERQALDAARTQGLQWVIVVKGTTVPGGSVFSQVAATASLDVRALEAQSGGVAASAVKQSRGIGRTPEAAQQAAANEAGQAAGADLAAALVAKEGAGL
jgi:hypothetical protein